jgi:hypothetical protein
MWAVQLQNMIRGDFPRYQALNATLHAEFNFDFFHGGFSFFPLGELPTTQIATIHILVVHAKGKSSHELCSLHGNELQLLAKWRAAYCMGSRQFALVQIAVFRESGPQPSGSQQRGNGIKNCLYFGVTRTNRRDGGHCMCKSAA